MKRVRQKTDAFCGPAVLEMLAGFIGFSINQNRLVRLSKMEKRIDRYGMNVQDLGKALKIVIPDVAFWYKENSKIGDLDQLVNEYKFPVGVEWQGVFEEYTEKDFPDDGHYGVVTHVDKKKNVIFISDPFRRFAMKDRQFKLDFFTRRWWDSNEIRDSKTNKVKEYKDNHMMFVITPRNHTFPEEVGMTRF